LLCRTFKLNAIRYRQKEVKEVKIKELSIAAYHRVDEFQFPGSTVAGLTWISHRPSKTPTDCDSAGRRVREGAGKAHSLQPLEAGLRLSQSLNTRRTVVRKAG
jgi:hypothetical protein